MNDLGTIDTKREANGFRLRCACGWEVTGFDEGELGEEYSSHVAETGESVGDHLVDELHPEILEIEVDPVAVAVTDDLLEADVEEEPLSHHDVNVLAVMIVSKLPDCPLDEWEELGLATIETVTDSDGETHHRSMQLNRNGIRVFRSVLVLAIKRA